MANTSRESCRPAAFAGSFYPGKSPKINDQLDELFANPVIPQDCTGIMVPHAGWDYSGRIAAQTIASAAIPETVLLLGPKHTADGADLAVSPHDSWSWPGGELQADRDLADAIVSGIATAQYDSAAHRREHSLEVELPLFHRRSPQTKVCGVVIGRASLGDCLSIGSELSRVLATLPRPVLLVVSSDMNHFAEDSENRRLDELAMRAIETCSPELLYETVVERFAISMCGVRPAVIAMEALLRLGQLKQADRVGYATSADVTGDTSRVVGYAGYRFH